MLVLQFVGAKFHRDVRLQYNFKILARHKFELSTNYDIVTT